MELRRGAALLTAVLAGAAAQAVVPAAAEASTIGPDCTIVQLPRVDGGDNMLVATDPTGRYQIGYRLYWDADGEYRQHLVTWHDGVATLGPELYATRTEFEAVNRGGVAAGFTGDVLDRQAAVFAYGRVVPLATPAPGRGAAGRAINAAGQVAGNLQNADAAPVAAVVWSPDGSARVLPSPDGFAYVEVFGLDEDGTVLGLASNDIAMHSDSRLVVWRPGGGPRVLPGTRPEARMFWPGDIRGGVVTGTQNDGNLTLRWDVDGGPPTVVDTEGLDLLAVNATGALLLDRYPTVDRPALLRDGVARPLVREPHWFEPLRGGRSLTDDDRIFGRDPQYADCAG